MSARTQELIHNRRMAYTELLRLIEDEGLSILHPSVTGITELYTRLSRLADKSKKLDATLWHRRFKMQG